MKRLSLGRLLLYVFLGLVARKIIIALISMHYVHMHKDEVSFNAMIFFGLSSPKMMSSESFKATVNSLPPNEEAFVLILNSHALNMTLNWLCNTEGLEGVHNKSLDTFWAESLSNVDVETRREDIVFDRASEVGDLIAGGYYYAKPSLSSLAYFERLAWDISWWYAPDNAYMTFLCELSGLANCGGLPFSLITNWHWLHAEPSNTSPSFIQFDGETNLGGKLGKMKRLGFYFLEEDGKTCNRTSVEDAYRILNERTSNWSHLASSSQKQFKFYQNVVDSMYSNSFTRWFLNRFMFPYAHYCMLSF
ncbi:unnamed protein product [Strongylus vulgaris]|uniref:Nucleotide-diphospho-sugar transferase domain-containing protein n=1 Tax=Strongylus vulgaris TaxID=40348 RepID=A0A3P7IY99_STRVU|nr:unnamed protein product [Strongylus vulgaris]